MILKYFCNYAKANMAKYFIIFNSIFILNSPCFAQLSKFVSKDQLNLSDIEFLTKQDKSILDDYDKIKHIWYLNSEDSKKWVNFKFYSYTYFTDMFIVDFIKIGSPRKNIIPFENIMDIRLEEKGEKKYIKITQLDTLFKIEDHYFPLTNVIILTPNIDSDKNKFYEYMIKTWKNNSNYLKFSKIYNDYYDEMGNKRLTPDNKITIDKITELKIELEKIGLSIVDRRFSLYLNYKDYSYKLDYINKTNKYHVTKLKIEPLPPPENLLLRIGEYEVHIKDKEILPFQYMDYLFIESDEAEINNIESLLNKYFKL